MSEGHRELPGTVVLTERRPRVCRLSPDDVEFLLASHRGHVEVLPTRRRHLYRVTARGHVGVIVTPRRRLVLQPKMPLTSLFHLLDPLAAPPMFDDDTATVEPGTAALEFLAARLAALMAERAASGLHRGYVERDEQGPFLQGRLDVAAQMTDPAGRKDQLHCRYEEFGVDVPCNQAARATAEELLRHPLLRDEIKASLRRSLQDYAGVRSLPPQKELLDAAEPDRLTESYRPLIALCRLLTDGLDPGRAAGDVACPAFLIDMDRVFERYVTELVSRAFEASDRHVVEAQPLRLASRPVAGQPDVAMRPDVLVTLDGHPALVVDAKWKRLGRSAVITDDVYQVVAYGAALGIPRAVLVYPGNRDRVWAYTFVGGPIQLWVATLRVVGSRERLEMSRRRLGRRARSWVKA